MANKDRKDKHTQEVNIESNANDKYTNNKQMLIIEYMINYANTC